MMYIVGVIMLILAIWAVDAIYEMGNI